MEIPQEVVRKSEIATCLQISVPRTDLYLPTNPASKVVAVIPESATPMQSAAKVPILVAFKVRNSVPHYFPW